MRTLLLDTGPLVAFLDRTDERHEDSVDLLNQSSGALVTTSAVVTETMYFLRAGGGDPELFVDFLVAGRIQVTDFCQVPDLRRASRLMAKYVDTPMDFADATLILLAEAIDSGEILTFDHRGFSTYRFGRNRAFRVVRRGAAS